MWIEPNGVGRIEGGEPEIVGVVDPVSLEEFLGFHDVRLQIWAIRRESGDERRHHRIEIGGAAHDADVGEFWLTLMGKVVHDAGAQNGGGVARMQDFQLRDAMRCEHAIPAIVGVEVVPA